MSASPAASAPRRLRVAYCAVRAAARVGWAEPEVLGLPELVSDGDAVFDVGAAYGMYAVPLAALVGSTGAVHSFEPQPRQRRRLELLARLVGASNLHISGLALGRRSGEGLELAVPLLLGLPIHGHAHVIDAHGPTRPTKRRTTLSVDVSTVDSWCEQHGIGDVSFIKADVEGFEAHVIDGAAQTIARSHPALLLEIEERHTSRYDGSAQGFADHIRSRWPGYRLYSWQSGEWVATESVTTLRRNYLFLHDDAQGRARVMPSTSSSIN